MADDASASVQVESLGQPLPDLKLVCGDAYPAPSDSPETKVAYVKKLIETTNPIAQVLAKQAARNTHYSNGRMWLSWSKQHREYRELPLEEHEVRASMNHIRPILRSRTQRLLSAPVSYTIIPDSNALEQRDRAKRAQDVLSARFKLTNMARKMDTALSYAYCGGVAAFKSFWNPSIGRLNAATLKEPVMEIVTDPATGLPMVGPDGQPMMQPQVDPKTGQPTGAMEDVPIIVEPGSGNIRRAEEGETPARYNEGDTDTALRTVFQIRLNPEATGWTQAEGLRYLLDLDEIPLSAAKQRWPHLADKLSATSESKNTGSMERSANTSIVRNPALDPASAFGAGGGIKTQQEDKVLVCEYWELPGPYFPQGRFIQIVGDQEAADGAFPDGFFPYDPLFDEPAEGWAYGRPTVNDMIDPTDVINTQWTAIVQEMKDNGIGQWVSWDEPGIPDYVGREPRLIIKIPTRPRLLQLGGLDAVFKRLDHPPVQSDRWRMIELAERTLQDIGAFHEITRGQVPPGVDSGVAITQLRDQENGQLKKAVMALEDTLKGWARKQLKLAKKYYTEERWIPVERPDLGVMVEGVTGLSLPDPDQILIEMENFKPHSEQAFRAEIKELMKDQLIPPDQGLKALDLGRGIEGVYASQQRQYAKARQENLWLERGEASYQEVGQQPAEDPVVPGQPLLDEVTGQPVMEPVFMVVVPTPDQQPPPDGSQPLRIEGPEGPLIVMPLCLPENDDHVLHREILQEIILDFTKPWAMRQLAMAHDQEHAREQQKQLLAQQQMAMQQQAPAAA